jgi:hypothetical protein
MIQRRCESCHRPGARLVDPGDGRGSRWLCLDDELALRLRARERGRAKRLATEGIPRVVSRNVRR